MKVPAPIEPSENVDAPPPSSAGFANITAVLSLLHESAAGNGGAGCGAPDSATRLFRGRPVLWWTLERLRRSKCIQAVAILCWEDQLAPVQMIATEQDAFVLAKGPRIAVPSLDAVTAARRWADGWRGGLFGTCEFDRGFHAPWTAELLAHVGGDGVLLVDPAAALVDAALIDGLIAHARQTPDRDFFFSQAAPGLCGVLIRPALLQQLSAAKTHPGRFLNYLPAEPRHDPISDDGCAPSPVAVARTSHRFTIDSDRQLHRVARATLALNGQLMGSSAEQLVHEFDSLGDLGAIDVLPREVVLEIEARRITRPIFAPAGCMEISRPPLTLQCAKQLFDELKPVDDLRLTLGGAGDSLLSPVFFEVLEMVRLAGIEAVHVETDFVGIDQTTLHRLAASQVDVVAVHIPAVTAATYAAVMGIDKLSEVVQNVRLFVEHRHALGRATPLLVPVFTKCRENLGEMEIWYDQWLPIGGSAVIVGAADYAGQIPDHAAADMTPPRRRPCVRLSKRMTILGDGKVVSCEQDITGRQVMGQIGRSPLTEIWGRSFRAMREDHACGRADRTPLCAACREWHRA